jgi:phosphoribosylanthranilate isomerase
MERSSETGVDMNDRSDESGPMWPPKIQIAGVSSLDEAMFCAQIGVDALGFTLEVPGGIHDELTWDKAAYIIQRLPRTISAVVITYLQSFEDLSLLVQAVNPHAVQFHGGIADERLSVFRIKYPNIKTIGRVTVSGADSIAQAACFCAPLWDAIILDSMDPISGRIGATGITHDWSVSSKIVNTASVPVILAGGLTPDNVVEAILTVRPAGVDSHTGIEDRDGSRNLAKIKAFTQAALDTFKITEVSVRA